MPIYGYECDACGKEFQTLVTASDTPACPACESQKLTRLLSLIARPGKGGADAGPSFCEAAGSGGLPPCATGPCCMGGGGGCG